MRSPRRARPKLTESRYPLLARGGVALYHRVSTVDQHPENARAELRAAATARGMTIALDIEETGSGAKNDRPGLQRILDAAHRGEISAVIVRALDRFGRSATDLLSNVRLLSNAGVRFIVTSQAIDVKPGGGDPMSNLLLAILAGVAEFEREIIRERIALGIRAARAAGRHLGRPRVESPAAAKLRALRARGKSWASIAKAVGLTPSTVRRRVAEAA